MVKAATDQARRAQEAAQQTTVTPAATTPPPPPPKTPTSPPKTPTSPTKTPTSPSVQECNDKNIQNFKINEKISRCKLTNEKDLQNIYDKQVKAIEQIKDPTCKDKAAEKLAELTKARDDCKNKLMDNIQAAKQQNKDKKNTNTQKYTEDVKELLHKSKKNEKITAQNAFASNDEFDSSDSYNQLIEDGQKKANEKRGEQVLTVTDKFKQRPIESPNKNATEGINTNLRNRADKAREKTKQQQQQQALIAQQDEYENELKNIQDSESDSYYTESLSGVTTPSSTLNFDQKNYLIEEGDKFLIFDINESQMAKIKDIQTNCNQIINSVEFKEFYDNFSTFHQLKEDDEIKRGKLIINKQRFKELLNDKKITNAYIITILKNNNNVSFDIQVSDLNNKSDILEFNQNIEDIENKINNIKNCNITDDDFNKININGKESDSMATSLDTLNKVINTYKLKIKGIQDEDNNKLQEVKKQLIAELNQIKTSNNITKEHNISGELNVVKQYNGDGGQKVTVGNAKLLKLIKTGMGMRSDVLDRSMILKLQTTQINKNENNNKYYKFGEYINKYTPYSAYNNAYLLLGLVISHQRYNNLKNKTIATVNNSPPQSPSQRTNSLSLNRGR